MNPIAISLGDPAGIGPEITAKSWKLRARFGLEPFFAVGDPGSVEAVWDGPMIRITDPAEAIEVFEHGLPLIPLNEGCEIVPGRPTAEGARCSLDSLEMAAGIARSGAAGALVTGPVSKAQLYDVGFRHPGQTEFVAERCGVACENAIMLLAGPTLKVVPLTTHMPLDMVSASLSVDMIVNKSLVTAKGITRNFGIVNPRLAFAGFNPHAGENGALGTEEIDILIPAIEILREKGLNVVGPLAADTMFHARARAEYDVAMCLYHDQALIPLKTLHFDDGVNMTLGLPYVRTSPDHGTAFGIAGRDVAEPGAMIAALSMAASAARNRATCRL